MKALTVSSMLWGVDTCLKPTIARVNGCTFGSEVGLACALLDNGPRAQREIESLFAQIAVGPITGEVRELTVRTIGRTRSTGQAREGLEAFFEKRPAHWTVLGQLS